MFLWTAFVLVLPLASAGNAAAAATTTKTSTSTVPIYTGTYYARSIATSACITQPSATASLAPYVATVKNQSYTMYSPASGSTVPQVQLNATTNQTAMVDLRNSSRIQYFLQNGNKMYIDNTGIYMYTPKCDTEVYMAVPNLLGKASRAGGSSTSNNKRDGEVTFDVEEPLTERSTAADTSISIDVSLKNQCGKPVPSLSASLICRIVAEPQVQYSLVDASHNDDYTGSCPFPNSTALEQTCETTTNTVLGWFSGDAANSLSFATGLGAQYLKGVFAAGVTTEVAAGSVGAALLIPAAIEIAGAGALAIGAFSTAMYLVGGKSSISAGVAKTSSAFCTRKYAAWRYQISTTINGEQRSLGSFASPPKNDAITTTYTTSISTASCTKTSSMPTPSSSNMIINPSFENDSGWDLQYTGASYQSGGAYNGSRWLEFPANYVAPNGDSSQLFETITNAYVNGEEFIMTFAYKVLDLGSHCDISLYCQGEGAGANGTYISVKSPIADGQWHYIVEYGSGSLQNGEVQGTIFCELAYDINSDCTCGFDSMGLYPDYDF